jgi:RimJ/RimL family protein N-acetyltransferase
VSFRRCGQASILLQHQHQVTSGPWQDERVLTLETDRLTLRSWEAEDADFAFDLYSRWEVQRFIGAAPQVMEHRHQAVERIRIWRNIQHPVHAVWAVQIKATGFLAGALLLKAIPASAASLPLQPSGDTEIGWHFHPDHWGRGYASEAASAVLEYAFAGGLTKVVAVTAPANAASQKVCRRIGMLHSGQTSKYYNSLCELFVVTAP